MMALSYWAKDNPWKARISIVGLTLLKCAFGLLAGLALRDLGIVESKWPLMLIGGVVMIAVLLYPMRGRLSKAVWRRKKVLDAVLLTSGFFLVTLLTAQWRAENPTSAATELKNATMISMQESLTDAQLAQPGLLKLNFNKNAAHGSPLKTKSGNAILLFLLALAAAGGLGYLVFFLSCHLSCSGYEALGTLVLVGGGLTILIGLILVSVRIFRWEEERKRSERNNPKS